MASVVSAFYYLRIVKVMYFDDGGVALPGRGRGSEGGARRRLRLRFLFMIFAGPLVDAAGAAAKSLTGQ